MPDRIRIVSSKSAAALATSLPMNLPARCPFRMPETLLDSGKCFGAYHTSAFAEVHASFQEMAVILDRTMPPDAFRPGTRITVIKRYQEQEIGCKRKIMCIVYLTYCHDALMSASTVIHASNI